jgi:hypothetical protein
MRKVTLFLLLLIYSTIYSQNLRTLDKDIVDENNNEIILRSAGLGGWMLQDQEVSDLRRWANEYVTEPQEHRQEMNGNWGRTGKGWDQMDGMDGFYGMDGLY